MIKRSLAIGLILALGASAFAQKFAFNRTYTVGDKDAYEMSMSLTGSLSMTMTMTSVQEVVKVYDDGGADIKVTTDDMKMNIGGHEISVPKQAQKGGTTMHVNKFGAPTEIDDAKAGRMSMSMMYSGMAAFRDGLTVGQSVPFEASDAKHPNIHTKGTVTLVSIENNLANLHVVANITDDNGKMNGHVDGTYSVDTTNSKLSKADLTMTMPGVPGGGDAHVVMTRKAA